ncbi:hypothetical protein HNR59_003775 [Aquamicrobium lusatiense]|jgi:hypothetical protein|uniref:Uncharacterized protein n=1 Tax=Aquamicrobium lusatiense TaxID=89772 RepID=A0A7W9S5A3_9HYPH|nr:hypothetical protein [Aquamicrobium lusatiense]MBB6014381.1 hypothetical protein [Aquamicrobium lusatiense]
MRISRLIGLAIVGAGCLVAAGQAHAISRYDPTRMSCGAIQDRVAREGAVILRYTSKRNPNLPIYDRYVLNNRFCPAGQVRERADVPSADASSCPVYKCVQPEFERRDRFWRFGH